MRNPLNNSNGKSDTARNCYTKKFRKGWDEIDWATSRLGKTHKPIKFKALIEGLRRKK